MMVETTRCTQVQRTTIATKVLTEGCVRNRTLRPKEQKLWRPVTIAVRHVQRALTIMPKLLTTSTLLRFDVTIWRWRRLRNQPRFTNFFTPDLHGTGGSTPTMSCQGNHTSEDLLCSLLKLDVLELVLVHQLSETDVPRCVGIVDSAASGLQSLKVRNSAFLG